eukprot:scaffold1.g5173.t1
MSAAAAEQLEPPAQGEEVKVCCLDASAGPTASAAGAGGAKAALLQTRDLLKDCHGPAAEWLLPAQASEPAATVEVEVVGAAEQGPPGELSGSAAPSSAEAGDDEVGRGHGGVGGGGDEFPTAQLVKLLASPLTLHAAAPGGGASGGLSPGAVLAGLAGSSGAPTPLLIEQQQEVSQLHLRLKAAEEELTELREARAVAEATSAALREELDAQAAAVAETSAQAEAAAVLHQQSAATLSAALLEQQCLLQTVEDERQRREAAEQQQLQLQNQLELLLLERTEGGPGAASDVDTSLEAGPLVAELQLLRSQLAASAASRTALASKLQARANERSQHDAQLARHAIMAQKSVNAANERAHALQESNMQLKATVALLQQRLEQQLAADAPRQAQVAAAAAAMQEGRHVVSQLQLELGEVRNELGAQVAAGQVLQQQVEAQQNQLVSLAGALQEQEQRSARLHRQRTELQGELSEAQQQLQASEAAAADAKEALQETCTKLVSLQQQCHDQQEEIEALRSRLHHAEHQLAAQQTAAERGDGTSSAGGTPTCQQRTGDSGGVDVVASAAALPSGGSATSGKRGSWFGLGPKRMDFFSFDEDSDEEAVEEVGYSCKENVIYAIEASTAMLEKANLADVDKDFRKNSWLEVAVKVVATVLRQQTLGGSDDESAVIFYCTKLTNTDDSLDGVFEFLELGGTNAARIRKMQDFSVYLDDSETREEHLKRFLQEVGSGNPQDNDTALRSLFMYAGTRLGPNKGDKVAQRLVVFTREARPLAPRADDKKVMGQVNTLSGNRCTLMLYPMVAHGEEFDLTPFWERILAVLKPRPEDSGAPEASRAGEDDEDYEQSQLAQITSLRNVARMRAHKKRAVTRLLWRIGNMEVAMQLFALYKEESKAKVAWLHAQSGAPVSNHSSMIDADTGQELAKTSIRHGGCHSRTYFPHRGGSSKFKNARFPKLYVTEEEVARIRGNMSKGLTLLGFKPRSALKPHHSLRSSSFLYPDERAVQGSNVAFISVWQAMLKRDAMAICSYVLRDGAEPRLVALLPQEEQYSEWGEQLQPSGMQLINLPFADDIRYPERDAKFTGGQASGGEAAVQASEAQVLSAGNLMSHFVFTEPAFYLDVPNPMLQRHWEARWRPGCQEHALGGWCEGGAGVVEATALDDDPPDLEGCEDDTLPNPPAPKQEEAILKFKVILAASHLHQEAIGGSDILKKKGSKRKVAAPVDEGELAAQVAALDIPGKAESGSLTKLTIDQLKKYLKLHSLRQTGVKADLVARIVDHLAKK